MSNKYSEPVARGKVGEPWTDLPTASELGSWGEQEQIAYNQQRRNTAKHNFYIQAFDFLYTNEVPGDYFEFGCHRCRTFRMALTEARRQNRNEMKFYAFDSFEGLPALQDPNAVAVTDYRKGALKTSTEDFLGIVSEHGIYVSQVETIKGFFDDSLTPALKKSMLGKGAQAALVCIDCDLYESAVPVFNFIEEFLQPGTLIYIDDYHVGYRGSPYAGVGQAFEEFKARSRYRFPTFLTVGGFGASFIACER